MNKRKISIKLSERSIEQAINQLEQYKREIESKTEQLRKRVAEELKNEASSGFSGAKLDDLLRGGMSSADVRVSIRHEGQISLVIASGEDAVWVEFGAGVYHNGPVNSSPHPKGSELGFTIGSYGKGNGQKTTWGYYSGGELKLTHGTPASMPMYNAVKAVCGTIERIAREVFV